MFIRIKSLPILLLLPLLLMVLSGCKYQNRSERPVRLVVSEQGLIFDGQPLSFEQPLKEWITVLGDNYHQGDDSKTDEPSIMQRPRRFIYPELGIDLEVEFNYLDPPSEYLEGSVLRDPYNRTISVVRIKLNPNITAGPSVNKQHRTHFYNTMYADYAIDFFGAIVDSNTPKEQILQFAKPVKHHRHFNSVGFRVPGSNKETKVQGNVSFNHFFGQRPEISWMMELTPPTSIRQQNQLKYFGVVVTK